MDSKLGKFYIDCLRSCFSSCIARPITRHPPNLLLPNLQLARHPSRSSIRSRQYSQQRQSQPKSSDGSSTSRSKTPRRATNTRNRKSSQLNVKNGKTRQSYPDSSPKKREEWQIQKSALKSKFEGEIWNPRKRLSPDALDGIRALHASDPEKYTTSLLADQFEVSPEAIRRILKSKWRPSVEEAEDRKRRWDKRGERIWDRMTELGLRPPKKWDAMGADKTGGTGRGDEAVPWEAEESVEKTPEEAEIGLGIPGRKIGDLV